MDTPVTGTRLILRLEGLAVLVASVAANHSAPRGATMYNLARTLLHPR